MAETKSKYELRQSKYDFTSRVFPLDLGQEDNAHYMIININAPALIENGKPVSRSRFDNGSLLPEQSVVDRLRFGDTEYNLGGTPINQSKLSPPRFTRRIQESIALHMPNGGLVFTEPNVYEEVSMTSLAGNIIGSTLGGIASLFNKELGKDIMKLTDSVGNVIKTGGQILGSPVNPRVEVLFSTRPQRQWVFELFLVPRSEKEAEAVKQIIQTIRYYAAPEISMTGFFYIPPAEFDITFFFNGKENQNLPRISTCVLERIDVDYAPENTYSTFKDGQPIATRLSLAFREIEILHKQRVYQGF